MRERVVWMLIAMMIVDITIGMYGLFKMQKTQEQTDRSQWAAMVQMHRQMVVEHKQTEDKLADLNKQSERMIEAFTQDLPETGGAWYTTLFLDDDWKDRPEQVELVSWFCTDPRLAKLKDDTIDNIYTPSHPLYKARYAKSIKRLPAIAVQDSKGVTRYAIGQNRPIPSSSDELAKQLQQIFRRWQDCCPRPFKQDDDEDEPPPIVQPQIPDNAGIPDILPPPGPASEVEQREEGSSFPVGLLILAVIVAFVIGGAVSVVYNIKRTPSP